MINKDYYGNKREELSCLIPAQYKKVLEIGCGLGEFRNNFIKECQYWGVEPMKSVASEALVYVDKILIGTYAEVADDLPEHYFDLVICNDVIEHMTDHYAFLQSIKTKMASDGRLIGSVPNVRCLRNLYNLLKQKEWRYEASGILDYTHMRFFTEKSLQRTLEENGYSIEKFVYLNSIFDLENGFYNSFYNKVKEKLIIRILGEDTEFIQLGFAVVVKMD